MVRVDECKPVGLLVLIAYIDLVCAGNEDEARARLLAGVQHCRPHRAPPAPSFDAVKHAVAGPPPQWRQGLRATRQRIAIDRLIAAVAAVNVAVKLTQDQLVAGADDP